MRTHQPVKALYLCPVLTSSVFRHLSMENFHFAYGRASCWAARQLRTLRLPPGTRLDRGEHYYTAGGQGNLYAENKPGRSADWKVSI